MNAAPPANYTSSGNGEENAPSPSGSKATTLTQPETKSGCLIATAAFGSELSPQVQFLRNFRDNRILSTTSGSSFMTVFNAWYYSFSPYVADYEREHPWLQNIVRTAIYPLLGILQLSEKSYSLAPGEFGSFVAGLTASSLIGLVYFTPAALCIKRISDRKFDFRVYAIIITTVTIALLIALLINGKILLIITTPLFVVTLCAISSIIGARIIGVLSKNLIICLKNLQLIH